MATKKSLWVLSGILVISAWVLGSAIGVGAETLKIQISNVVTKQEQFSVGDAEDTSLFFLARDPFASFLIYDLTALLFDLHDGIGIVATYGAYGIGWKLLIGELGSHGMVVFLPHNPT